MENTTQGRKLDHLNICSRGGVEAREKTTWLEQVELVHSALPDVNREDLDLSTKLFGKKLRAPVVISAMTGGHDVSAKINRSLAGAAEKLGIGFGLGSQRAMIEDPGLAYTYQVRDVAPDTLVLGNIGAPQLGEYGSDRIEKAVDAIGADVLAVHLNSLQEAVQPEGDTDFDGYAKEIEKLVKGSKMPVIAKETGAGLSRECAKKLIGTGVAGLDTGGAGGTSFAAVEYLRTGKETGALWDWGIPTAASILEVRSTSKEIPLIATGGIRTGVDATKALALGADAVGICLPLVNPAKVSVEKVELKLRSIIDDLRTAMFLVGAKNLAGLQDSGRVVLGDLREWVIQRGLDL